MELEDGRDVMTIEMDLRGAEDPTFSVCCYFEGYHRQIVNEYDDFESAYLNLESIVSTHH